ncbi:response regulator transcription factor [Candidatus Chloroploca sp. Khr17]|uniref:response regulator transcription factor n=1 Tax=Candidatus Chloroploca sp. Khr17 TaxID=2496869 RepID=UPI003519077F
MPMKQRILVVDDDQSIAHILRSYLEQAGYHVLTAHDGNAALQAMRYEQVDLVILDLMLPGRDGWSLIRVARSDAILGALPIILVTARIDEGDKILGLELGADDYITKPFNGREVVARVGALLRRRSLDLHGSVTPRTLIAGELCLNLDQHSLTIQGQPVELTRTEFKLLEALLEHPGYTLTRDDLLERAMGYAYEGLGRVLDTHIRNLRRKIEPDPNNPRYICTVYGVGYRLAKQ